MGASISHEDGRGLSEEDRTCLFWTVMYKHAADIKGPRRSAVRTPSSELSLYTV